MIPMAYCYEDEEHVYLFEIYMFTVHETEHKKEEETDVQTS